MTNGVSVGVGVNVEDGGVVVAVDGGVVGTIMGVVAPLMEVVLGAGLSTLPELAKAVSATRRAALTRKAIPVVLIMSFITSGLASPCCSRLLPTRSQTGYQLAKHFPLNNQEVNKPSVQGAV